MIWTLDQVHQAQRLHAKATIDDAVLVSSNGVAAEVTRDKMARAMAELGHPLGLEVHAGDLEFQEWRDDSNPFTVRIECRWRPSTEAVEMRGGPRDGEVVAVRRDSIGDPLRFPVFSSASLLESPESVEVVPATTAVTYALAGWNEDERRWVYDAR